MRYFQKYQDSLVLSVLITDPLESNVDVNIEIVEESDLLDDALSERALIPVNYTVLSTGTDTSQSEQKAHIVNLNIREKIVDTQNSSSGAGTSGDTTQNILPHSGLEPFVFVNIGEKNPSTSFGAGTSGDTNKLSHIGQEPFVIVNIGENNPSSSSGPGRCFFSSGVSLFY